MKNSDRPRMGFETTLQFCKGLFFLQVFVCLVCLSLSLHQALMVNGIILACTSVLAIFARIKVHRNIKRWEAEKHLPYAMSR